MSVRTVKVAISLPKDVMAEIEDFRHKLGLARSQAIVQAVSLWLKRMKEDALEKQYAKGYKNKPENKEELEAFSRLGLLSFGKDKW